MADPIDRGQFLRGDLSGKHREIRPPWSKPLPLFYEICTRCDACIESCQEKIIRRGSGGYPRIDFSSGGCSFCGDCVRACRPGALAFSDDPGTSPWFLSVEIMEDCLAMNGIVCRSCGEVCEESAIRFQLQTGGRAQPGIDADLCNGCGECFGICPSHSIKIRPLSSERAA